MGDRSCSPGVTTSSHVDIVAALDATLQDAFQFGDADDTTWNFTGEHFRMDIRPSLDTDSLMTLSTDNGRIVVDDVTQRVLHLNVPDTDLAAVFVPGTCYVYDLIMYDDTAPDPIRVRLMHGRIRFEQAITGD